MRRKAHAGFPHILSICVSITALLAPAQGVLAQVIALDEIVVSPNRTPTGASRTGVSVSALDSAALEAGGDASLGAQLARLPGVSYVQNGPLGSAGVLRVRGADSRYIATYFDGIRIDDPSGVQVTFNSGVLFTPGIARLELLRGSQSAVWGGSAVGGVLNVETPRAEGPGFSNRTTLEFGTYNTLAATTSLAFSDDRADIAFSLSHLRSDGFSAASAGTVPDGMDSTRAALNGRFRVNEAVTLGFAVFGQTTRQDYDGFNAAFTQIVDRNNVQRRREAGARAYAELAAGRTRHLFEVTGYTIDREFDQEGAISRFAGSRVGVAWRAETGFSDRFSLLYGLDYTEERAAYANVPGGSETIGIAGGFLQALWAPNDRLDVSAAVRVDQNSGFGTFPTGRVALAFRPDDRTVLRAAVATGFRAPSVDERFGNYPGFFPFVGNPALRPEESRSYEIGLERRFAGGAMLSATMFLLDIDNLVTFQAGAPSTLVNLAGVSRRSGVELAGTLPLGERANLGLAYTYIEATRPNGARLGLVPRHDLALSLDAELGQRLRAFASLQHQADRLNEFGSAPMPDFTVVNAGFRLDIGRRAEAVLRVENLFDTRYELVPGYATSGRAVYVGLRTRF